MRPSSNSRIVAMASCLLVVTAVVPVRAQEAWEAALRLQLETEKKCQLQAFVSVRELPVEGLGGLEGRIRCGDGREFDFSRQKPHQKFDIHLCQPAVC